MSREDLVVTGAAALCPGAHDMASFAEMIRHEAAAGIRVADEFLSRLTLHQSRRLDRLSQLIVLATLDAAASARLESIEGDRIGLVVGTALGCLQKTERQLRGLARAGLGHSDPMGFPDSMDNAPAAHAAIALGCRGPSFTVMQRETSGECAVILAALLLRAGAADAVVVAAGDAASPEIARVLPRFAPGLDPGEGAGALVLERAEPAARRGARLLGRLAGYAQESAAGRSGSLRPASREAVRRAGERALAMAGLTGAVVDSVGQDALQEKIGWCMADGILRVVLGLARFEGEPRPVLVAGAARGGTAAALVFCPPPPP